MGLVIIEREDELLCNPFTFDRSSHSRLAFANRSHSGNKNRDLDSVGLVTNSCVSPYREGQHGGIPAKREHMALSRR